MQRHVDPREAEEVVRLAVAREAARPADGPTVESLAEMLGVPVSEVERLLAQVRGRAVPTPSARRFGDRSSALSAAIVLALVVTVGGIGGTYYWVRHRATVAAVAETGPAVFADGPGGRVTITDHGVTIHDPAPILEPAPTVEVSPAPSFSVSPLAYPNGVTQTSEELRANAAIVRNSAKDVARLTPESRKAQYEPLMEAIQSQRNLAAEIRRKAPAHRTADEKAFVEAVDAYDRLFEEAE